MKLESFKLVLWPFAVLFSCLLCTCCETISDESTISGQNGCLYGFICYNAVGKCDLDVTFKPDKSGTAEEIHYDRHYDVVSVTSTAFTWKQKGDKVTLKGGRAVAYRDGDSSVNDNWSGEFDCIDGVWLPGEGFSSGYKEYYYQQKAEKLDEERVKECISVTKTFYESEVQLEFYVKNGLGKYYQESAYQFGIYQNDDSYTYCSNDKGENVSLLYVDAKMRMYLSSKKNLEKKGSSSWTSGERSLYNSILNKIANFKSRIEKKNLGYVFVKLNGKEYVLLEF